MGYLSEECAVELDDVDAFVAEHDNIKFLQQLLLFLLIHCRPYPLNTNTSHQVTQGASIYVYSHFTELNIYNINNVNACSKVSEI